MPSLVSYTPEVFSEPYFSRFRTGAVFHIDDFENYNSVITEKWVIDGTAASGFTGVLATDYPLQGKYCVKLTTGTTANDYVNMYLYKGMFRLEEKLGLEFAWQSPSTATNIQYVQAYFENYDGTDVYQAAVKWLGTTNLKWQYRNSVGSFADVTDGSHNLHVAATTQPSYHHVKFVVDFKNSEYVRLMCDDKEFDLSGLGIGKSASATTPQLRMYIECATDTTTAVVMRVDGVVLTYKES